MVNMETTEEQVAGSGSYFNPFAYVLWFLGSYGWYVVCAGAAAGCAAHRLRPRLRRWREAREDALYHKDPDAALARLEAVQRARGLQQRALEEASARALRLQREREERKRAEAAERLRACGAAGGGGGQRLGTEDDYLPLSGGSATSSYRPPKKSKCGGGGCGR